MVLYNAVSKVFGSTDIKLESALKNPNQFRDAVIFEALSNLSDDKTKEFVSSPEAKAMIDNGLINHETLQRLVDQRSNKFRDIAICHMAKENGDPIWDEFIKARIEERRLMNELIKRYADKAQTIVDNVDNDFIKSYIPEYFRP